MFSAALVPKPKDNSSAEEKREAAELQALIRYAVPSKTLKEMSDIAPQGVQFLAEEAKLAALGLQQGLKKIYDVARHPLVALKEEGRSSFAQMQLTTAEIVLVDLLRVLDRGHRPYGLGCGELETIRSLITTPFCINFLMTVFLESVGGYEAGIQWSPLVYEAMKEAYDDYYQYGQASLTELLKQKLRANTFKAAARGLDMRTGAGAAASSTLAENSKATTTPLASGASSSGGGHVTVDAAVLKELQDKVSSLEFVVGVGKKLQWDAQKRRYSGYFPSHAIHDSSKVVANLKAFVRMPEHFHPEQSYGTQRGQYQKDKGREARDRSPHGGHHGKGQGSFGDVGQKK